MLKEQHINPTPFYELLSKEEDFELAATSIEHMIYHSFGMIDAIVLGHKPEITQTEVKRRFFICEKWFRIMRGDYGFGLISLLRLQKAPYNFILGISGFVFNSPLITNGEKVSLGNLA